MERTFLGYARPNGSVGTRNYLVIIPSVFCGNTIAKKVASAVPGAVALTHCVGCAQVGLDLELTARTLKAMACHPNAGAVIVIGIGCERFTPQELYEAAEIDGANNWRKFFSITIPQIVPTILFAWVMLTIGGFNVYTSIKLMTNGNPVHQTDTVLTWMYYKAFSQGEFGYAAALSFIIALTLGILAVFQFKAMKRKEVVE